MTNQTDPAALVRAALEAAAEACADETWRREGDDAFTRGLDCGSTEQAAACAVAIRALADCPDVVAGIIERVKGENDE
ncbi:hypothetical protein RAZWK3B_15413 [Roseobacter sp. AzwK-3b]|uniref:hypothetical protein n=1 Tax=Roseobacter sp. AzwK-3b TaxID=351016 RepID=UPI000156A3BC|nr:hypothetical protein [Roseobacter sp. AzwK-3b]EDM70798.1 hypothetical protein RAZWK3B_15413 [Roseobacter sp. AzwK-3b]